MDGRVDFNLHSVRMSMYLNRFHLYFKLAELLHISQKKKNQMQFIPKF
jgi:hypothetical protein